MRAERRLAVAYLETQPRQAARALERLPLPECAAIAGELEPEVLAPAVREMVTGRAAECLTSLAPPTAAAILERVTPDHAADILRRVDGDAATAILEVLPSGLRDAIGRVLRYPEGTAGALMDPSIFALPDDIDVAEGRERLMGATRELLYYIYVVNREQRLVGVLDIPELMLARPQDELRLAMHDTVDRLEAWAPASMVREHPGWRSFHALPVVDEREVLVGAIRYQTLRRLEQHAASAAATPGTTTALALGELYRIGIRGLVGSVATAAERRAPAATETEEDTDA